MHKDVIGSMTYDARPGTIIAFRTVWNDLLFFFRRVFSSPSPPWPKITLLGGAFVTISNSLHRNSV